MQRAWADRRRRGGGLSGAAACRRVVLHRGDGMSAVEHSAALPAFARANHDSPKRIRSSLDPIAGLVLALETRKPIQTLADYAGIGVRGAGLVIEGRNFLSRKSQNNCLRSPIGDRVLDVILGDPAPAWREAERRMMEVKRIEQRLNHLEEERRHLEALLAGRR